MSVPGSSVKLDATTMGRSYKVRAIAHELEVAKVTVRGVPDQPGIAAGIFEPLAERHISVDTIVQNASVEKLTDLTFTLAVSDLAKTVPLVESASKEIGAAEVVAEGFLDDETPPSSAS